jgi:hypothetical protein
MSGGRRFPQVGSCHPWAIAVRGWVGSSLSVSGGVIVRERAVAIAHVQGVVAVLLVQVVVWNRRSWVVAVRPRGGAHRPAVEGVVVLEWEEGSPLSVRARPPWAVVVPRWGLSPYVGGQRS